MGLPNVALQATLCIRDRDEADMVGHHAVSPDFDAISGTPVGRQPHLLLVVFLEFWPCGIRGTQYRFSQRALSGAPWSSLAQVPIGQPHRTSQQAMPLSEVRQQNGHSWS
jgi:hypothetical protein